MQVGDSKFKKCPHCGHKNRYFVGPFYVNFYGWFIWSDGEKFSEQPRLKKDWLQICDSCKSFYWHRRNGRIGKISFDDYVRALDFYKKIYETNPLKYWLFKNRLLYIRLAIWRSYNDYFRVYPVSMISKEQVINDDESKRVYTENARELIKLMGRKNDQNALYVAELYRNIDDFGNAKMTLERVRDRKYDQVKNQMLIEITNRSSRVFQVNHR